MNKRVQQFTAFVCLFCHLACTTLAQGPAWWISRGVMDPAQNMDDYAVANQGQLKNFAAAAAAQMAVLPNGGAGTEITAMIQGWKTEHGQADDYAVATLGQAKAVARMFYQRLQQIGLVSMPAWATGQSGASDYAVINLGQLKSLFAFVIPTNSFRQATLAGLGTMRPALRGTSLAELLSHGSRPGYNYVATGISAIPSIFKTTRESGGSFAQIENNIDNSKVQVRSSTRSCVYQWYWSRWNMYGSSDDSAYFTVYSSGPVVAQKTNDWQAHIPPWPRDFDVQKAYKFVCDDTYGDNLHEIQHQPSLEQAWDESEYEVPRLFSSETFNYTYDHDVGGEGIGELFQLEKDQHYLYVEGDGSRYGQVSHENIIAYLNAKLFYIELTEPALYPIKIPLHVKLYNSEAEDPEVPTTYTLYFKIRSGQYTSAPFYFGSVLHDLSDQPATNLLDLWWNASLKLGEPELDFSMDSASLRQQDIAGPERRKIGLNGVPLPDEQPQRAAETDIPKEESYVDGYNLSLKHSTSDVYIPLGSSELPLTVRRQSQEATWSKASDVPLKDRMTAPFGQGWGGGLCSYVDFREDSQGPDRAVTVIDENGNSQQFLVTGNEFEAMPFSSTDSKSFMNTLTKETIDGEEHLVYTKKYGTKLIFERTRIENTYSFSADRPLSYTIGNASPGTAFKEGGQLPGGNWTLDTLNLNKGTGGTWTHTDGTKITTTPWNVAYVQGADGTYVTTAPGSGSVASGLNWSATQAGIPEWTDFSLDPLQQEAAGATDDTKPRLPGTQQRDPLERRTIKTTENVSYSVGNPPGRYMPPPPLLPSRWNPSGHIGQVRDSTAKPVLPHVATHLPVTKDYLKGSVRAIRDAGGVFADFGPKPFKQIERQSLFNGIASGIESKAGTVLSKGPFTQEWKKGYQSANLQQAGKVRAAASRMIIPARQTSTPPRLSAFGRAGQKIGLGAEDMSEVSREGFGGSLAPEDGVPPEVAEVASGYTWVKHYYYRLSYVEDSNGNRLNYHYPETDGPNGNRTLIPDQITDPKRSQAVLTIAHDGKKVNSITDSSNNQVSYRYRTVPVDNDELTLLERVTYADGSFVHYGYDHDAELDRNSYSIVHHLNLGAILNSEGHAWIFQYEFASDLQHGGMIRPEIKDGGLPRWVSCITLPNGKKATFTNDRYLNRTADGMTLGRISNSVCDVDGTVRSYTFGGAQLAQSPKMISSDVTKAAGLENYLMFTTLDIYLGQDMVESFEFDPEAGLALKSATDLSGKTTSWEYKDLGPFYSGDPNTEVNNGFKVSAPLNLFRYHNDPTAKINALGQRTEYTYDKTTRVMDSIKDPLGRVTRYTIQPTTGLRTEEKRYNSALYPGAAPSMVSHTVYDYGDATFKAFMTKVTRKKLPGDPDWAVDMSTTYTPDSQGRVSTEKVEGTNATTSYTYDANGNKQTVTDPKNYVTRFAYDGRGRLKSVIYAEGTVDQALKDYTYDSRGNKIVEVDENNGTTFRVYDEMNREVLAIFDLNGNGVPDGRDQDIVTTTEYNPFGQPMRSMNPNGVITENEYDGLGRLCVTRVAVGTAQEAETYYFYEGNNGGSVFDTSTFKPNRVVDARGYQTVTKYDSLYRPTMVMRQYLPGAANNTADSGFWAATTTTYDDVGNVWIVTDPKGLKTETLYDALNRPVETRTGNFGADSTPDQQRISTTSYTSTGLAWKSVDPMGRVTETEYDAAGRAVKTKLPDLALSGNAPLIPIIETGYDLAGNVTSVTDPLGRVNTTAYDARNRPVTVTSPAVLDALTGEMAQPVVRTFYDPGGRVVRVTDPIGGNTDTYYDLAGRALQVQSPAVAIYGESGLSVTATNRTYDKVGNILTVTDAEGRTTQNFYDPLNRLYQTTDAALISTVFGYDAAGNRTSVTDGKTQQTTFAYDGLNRLLMDQPPTGNPTLHYYDTRDKATTVLPNGKALGYFFDIFGQLKAVNVLKKMGNTTQFGYFYDKTWRTLTYDKAGNLLSTWESELAGTFSPTLTSTTYTYDAHNRRITERTGRSSASYGSGGITTAYSYDLVGNRTRMSVPGSNDLVLISTYDALNRLVSLEEKRWHYAATGNYYTTERTTTWEYDLAGRTRAQDLANGTRIVNTHDAQGRLTARTLLGTAAADRPLLSQQSYLYDATANLRTMSEQYAGQATARTVTNTYDAALRLDTEQITEADGVSTLSNYDYDDAGNRTQLTKTTGAAAVVHVYSHNELNQLTGFTKTGAEAVSYTYDDNGNRATRTQGTQTDTYTWDVENRLVQIAHAATAKTYRYGYDHRTRRVIRQEGAETTLVQHAGGTSFAEWTLPTGAVLPATYGSSGSLGTATLSKVFIRGSDMGGGVGGLLYSEKVSSSTKPTLTISSNASTWTQTTISNLALAPSLNHYNGRGDVVAKTDASGSVTWTGSYEAFGTRTRETGTNDDRQRANTKDEDPTGLLNEGFRYRDLETGTWLSRDPAGFVDGPNLYAYVQQNPWTKFDPHGLFWSALITAGFAAYDTYQYATGQMSGKEYAAAMALNGAALVADIATAGQGGGLAVRAANAAIKVAKAVDKADTVYSTANGAYRTAEAIANGDAKGAVINGALTALGAKQLGGGGKAPDAPKGDAPPGNSSASTRCFLQGTAVLTPEGEVPIESMTVGSRVSTPEFISGGDISSEIDPSTWREFHVRLKDANTGGWDVWDVTLLRPADWLTKNGTAEGNQVWINLEEMQAKGWADVIEVKPCPPIKAGKGRVVTATMTHSNDDVRHLRLSTGEDLGVTGNHRMFSAERNDWVRVRDLRNGEALRTDSGTATVASITSNPGRHQVFNLEVEADHCYFVGATHALAHNDCDGGLPESAQDVRTHDGQVIEGDDLSAVGMRVTKLGQTYKIDGDQASDLTANGLATPTGKDYIGSSTDLEQRHLNSTDGRDRSKAEVVDEWYPDDLGRKKSESEAIDSEGLDNLDNKIDAPDPDKD